MSVTEQVVRRTNLPVAGSWEALVLDVERPGPAALRVEVAGRGRLLLRQGDSVALLAVLDDDRAGVDYLATGRFRSPVPPVRAARAAALARQREDHSWYAGWAHHFATALAEVGSGPLHAGRWVISAEVPRLRSASWAELLLPHGPGRIDWFTDNGAWQVLPLRRLADPGDGRVRAYRKQSRDGSLPPVLLWWISGLDSYLVLDGHDRLVAALAERRPPPLLGLSLVRREQAADEAAAVVVRHAAAVAALARAVDAGTPGASVALAAVNRRVARDLSAVETGYGPTRAWPLPGGSAAWTGLVRTLAPGWPATAPEPTGGSARWRG
ncbi:hypothetical protein O7627_19720 [Solwaraspora sp. WMMD1047]|uniref:hypothetical protein n=1 Tax=Solwaraspora sp. WMMD1047 TaxID=3016102 RepID=UPI0024175BA7|nr:hypothetical protein [Solwaraspora sp. WMMD1047]MDG4831530.1 hypothetical protein [Solwaraspora sp. WMMD1047]